MEEKVAEKKPAKKVAKKKVAKKKVEIDKRSIVKRLANPPNVAVGQWWGKEMSIFKRILALYPELKFWEKVILPEVQSMAQFTVEPLKTLVKRKYLEYNIVIPEKVKIEIGETVGEDIIYKKKQTLIGFIDGKKERSKE